jgi:hypothetical protein
MEHEAPAIFVALEHSSFASAIRQSSWLYPLANVGHIVALVFFAGAVAVMDVRLLGGLAATAPGPIIAQARNFAIAAFGAMAITGFMLFSTDASHIVTNPAFQIKAAFVAVGLGNIGLYEFGLKHDVAGLAPGTSLPARAKAIAALSLAIWISVAACGRSIAYF